MGVLKATDLVPRTGPFEVKVKATTRYTGNLIAEFVVDGHTQKGLLDLLNLATFPPGVNIDLEDSGA